MEIVAGICTLIIEEVTRRTRRFTHPSEDVFQVVERLRLPFGLRRSVVGGVLA